MAKRNYTEKDVTYFSSDVEKVQAKPNMYMGSLDEHGIFTVTREALDNATDEARAGRNDFVGAVVEKSGHILVYDHGAGIPVNVHPKAKIPTIVHIFTVLQSSGKIKSEAYKNSIGTHGAGITVTNALSETLECWTYRDKNKKWGWWYIKFENGKLVTELTKVKPSAIPISQSKGTIIRFKPSKGFFGDAKLKVSMLAEYCKISSYVNPKISYELTAKGKTKKWLSKAGLDDYLTERCTVLEAAPKKKLLFKSESGHLELALAFTDNEGTDVKYMTNTVNNEDGGVHAEHMGRVLLAVLKNYGPKLEFTSKDLLDGVVGLLNFNIDDAQFSNQRKDKLVDLRVKDIIVPELTEAFTAFFRSNRTFALEWVKRASQLRKAQSLFQKNKQIARKVKKASETISEKLADVSGKAKPEECELYLVEGDSAGGLGKLARCKDTQALFPLRGKPLNVMEAQPERILNNNEIPTLLSAVGFDFDSDEPAKKLKYGKIIILADADVDGSHIETLLLAFFYKFAPHYFTEKRIYTIATPEFVGRTTSKTFYGKSKASIYKKAKTENVVIQHFKGLGEMNQEDLDKIAFDKSSRKLLLIKAPTKEQKAKFERLMGKNSEYRKKLLGV